MSRTLGFWERDGAFPHVSVIILNFRKADSTITCLDSLEEQDYPGVFDVLLVENGSGDGSMERLSFRVTSKDYPYAIRLIALEENSGFTGGVLAAWPKARGDLVCLLNNDTVLDPACLRTLVDAYRGRSDLGAVWPFDAPMEWLAARRRPSPEDIASLRNGTHSVLIGNIWTPVMPDYRQSFAIGGVCLLLDPQLVDEPFPAEYFAYQEDVFLSWRLRLRGLVVERVPEAVLYHMGSEASWSDEKLQRCLAVHAEKNRLANIFVFYSAATLWRLAPLLAFDEAKKLAAGLARALAGKGGSAYLHSYLSVRLWLWQNLRWLKTLRERMQQERTVPDSSLLRLMTARLTMKSGSGSILLNTISLIYCRAVGLETIDSFDRTGEGRARH